MEFAAKDQVSNKVPKAALVIVAGSKLDTRWLGPRMITARVGEHSYKVRTADRGKEKVYHRDQLKPYHHDVLTGASLPLYYYAPSRAKAIEIGEEEDRYWEVEKVIRVRRRNGKLEYLTKWKDWKDATWEPVGSFVTEVWGKYLGSNPALIPTFKKDW